MAYAEEMAKPTNTPMTTERDKPLSVRFSPAEYEEIQIAAARIGVRAGTFLRIAALEKARATRPAPADAGEGT